MAKGKSLPYALVILAAVMCLRHFGQLGFTNPTIHMQKTRECSAVEMKAGGCPFAGLSGWNGNPHGENSKSMQQDAGTAGADVMEVSSAYRTHEIERGNKDWWPNNLDLAVLQGIYNDGDSTPVSSRSISYADEFKKLDLDALKKDVFDVMTTSQDWWPADYGHYGPFFIRMAWHSAGTYRTFDGRGGGNSGNMRFAPLNSWPDNANLDKAKRLLWPIKKKYGRKISWADLMIFAGNCALESMGFEPFGFAGGREDIWEPEKDINWGAEKEWLADERHSAGAIGEGLDRPLGAVQMGLIYVNPEGPGAVPDTLLAAQDIRATFGRMAMNDEETVALIAGGHTFGKAHGAADPGPHVGPEPEGGKLEDMGFGWMSNYKSGKGVDTITSGLEGAWTQDPTKWDNGYFENMFKYDWEKTKSPAGATQWIPKDGAAADSVPDAHDPTKRHAPIMFTTDLALKDDPAYAKISKRFYENPQDFKLAFAKAWYKLTHRDMGPTSRLLGKFVPEAQIWQDPVPAVTHTLIGQPEVEELKGMVLQAGLTTGQLVRTAWASASTYRITDHRGGANGARIRLSPQKDWEANDPADLEKVLGKLEEIQAAFNAKHSSTPVSMADLIVLAGGSAIEDAAKKGGHEIKVPFSAGRTDASAEQTDAESFSVLEPDADGFRNFVALGNKRASPVEKQLVDRAQMLTLTSSEMTVLVGGLRVLDANAAQSQVGVLTKSPGTLTNDFFVNLLGMDTTWSKKGENLFEGSHYSTGDVMWTGTAADLVFGSNSELRAIAEYYATDDAKEAFVADFVAAWVKVMNLDRFDLE